MLAYVFWHWPRPALPISEYEHRQRRFHEALMRAAPAGFERSFCHRVSGASWTPEVNAVYEDWYLVRDSAALDSLNEAAVTGHQQEPHDRAAAASAGGAAGVLRLRLGAPVAPGNAAWFTKPDGMTYESLWTTLAPVVEATHGALWSRYMVLGPSPEFCLQYREPPALPPPFKLMAVSLHPVWPNQTFAL